MLVFVFDYVVGGHCDIQMLFILYAGSGQLMKSTKVCFNIDSRSKFHLWRLRDVVIPVNTS